MLEILEDYLKAPVEPFLALVANEVVPFILFYGLVGVGLIILLWAVFSIHPKYRQIKEIHRSILILLPRGEEDEIRLRNFFYKKEEVGQEILKSNLLAHSWAEYTETFILEEEKDKEKILNISRPQEYLLDNLQENIPTSFKIAQASGNYFIGLGLLLTFIGLVAALDVATGSFNVSGSVGPDHIQEEKAVAELLRVATFKFLTSVGGLFVSIILGITTGSYLRLLNGKVEKICSRLERSLEMTTSQYYDRRNADIQAQQLRLFETFSTDLAVTLGEQINAAVRDGIHPLASAINDLGDHFGEMNQEALQKALQDFRSGLTETVGQEMLSVVSSLGDMRTSIQNLPQTLSAVNDSVMQNIQATSNTVSESIKANFENVQEQIEDLSKNWAQGVDQSVVNLQDKFTTVGDNLAERTEQAGQNFSNSIENSMEGFNENITTAGENLLQSSQHAGNAFSEEISNAGYSFSNSISQSTEQLVSRLEEFSGEIQRNFAPLLDSLEQFGSSLSLLQENIQSGAERLNEITQNLTELASENTKFTENLNEITLKLEPVGEKALASIESLERVTEGLEEMRGQLSSLSIDLQATNEAFKNSFQNIDQDLENVFIQFREGTESQLTTIRQYSQDLSTIFQSALASLSETVEDIKEQTDDN